MSNASVAQPLMTDHQFRLPKGISIWAASTRIEYLIDVAKFALDKYIFS